MLINNFVKEGTIMEDNKISQILRQYQGKLTEEKLNIIKSKLKAVPDERFDELMTVKMKNPVAILLVSIFLGIFGIDRFMVNSVGMGVLKLFTFGGFGIIYLYDIFTISKKGKEKNYTTLALSI